MNQIQVGCIGLSNMDPWLSLLLASHKKKALHLPVRRRRVFSWSDLLDGNDFAALYNFCFVRKGVEIDSGCDYSGFKGS